MDFSSLMLQRTQTNKQFVARSLRSIYHSDISGERRATFSAELDKICIPLLLAFAKRHVVNSERQPIEWLSSIVPWNHLELEFREYSQAPWEVKEGGGADEDGAVVQKDGLDLGPDARGAAEALQNLSRKIGKKRTPGRSQ